jgi:predicted permease
LIISIIIGILLSIGKIKIPVPLSASLEMLSSTTSAVAIFMLGAFLFGREYTEIKKCIGLSLFRIVILPIITYSIASYLGFSEIERSVLTLMNSMPIAISVIILSERYNFYKNLIASLILVSSIGAGLYLNLWLAVLGYS